jgi:hypothetical protein
MPYYDENTNHDPDHGCVAWEEILIRTLTLNQQVGEVHFKQYTCNQYKFLM